MALRPHDGADLDWVVDGVDSVARAMSAHVRAAARAHDARCYRLSRLVFAVLGREQMDAGWLVGAMGAGVVHGSAELPAEGCGSAALRLALERMQARGRWQARSAERQVRDVLLRVLAERRTTPGDPTLPRVAELAVSVGRRLGLRIDELDDIVRAAELQDLGKLLLPDAILSKSGQLTADEWLQVRRHPVIAERILGAAPALAPVAALVRSSCERYDGSGYPDGLAGERIAPGARIIAVCVAFDAMTADRPYRRALPTASAVAELRRCAGRHFDPAVVDEFCRMLAEREREREPAASAPTLT